MQIAQLDNFRKDEIMTNNRERFGGGKLKGFADDVYGQPGHSARIKRIDTLKISASRETPKPEVKLTLAHLLKPGKWIIVSQLALLRISTTESLVNALKEKSKENSMSAKVLRVKLQEFQAQGICIRKIPEGQQDEYWSLTSQAQKLAGEHLEL